MQALETSIANDGWIGAITVAGRWRDVRRLGARGEDGRERDVGRCDRARYRWHEARHLAAHRHPDRHRPARGAPRGWRRIRIAALNLEWEPDVLSDILARGDIDLSALNFTLDEWADVARPPCRRRAGAMKFDATPEDGPTRAQLGDLWIHRRRARLLVGDCTERGERGAADGWGAGGCNGYRSRRMAWSMMQANKKRDDSADMGALQFSKQRCVRSHARSDCGVARRGTI